MNVRRKIGLLFGSFAGAGYAVWIYGCAARDGRFFLAGLVGAAWFTLLFALPREIFLKQGEE